MATSLPEFPPFDCEDLGNAGPRWKKWVARFEVLLMAMDIKEETEASKKRQKALLLHYMGAECYDIYHTLKKEADDYDAVKKSMTDYFVPKANSEFEKYVFRNTKQTDGETLDQFCTRLRKLSVNCGFVEDSVDSEIKSQMVQGCNSVNLRKKALSKTMTLQVLLETGKAMEQAKTQATVMQGGVKQPTSDVVNKTGPYKGPGRKPRHRSPWTGKKSQGTSSTSTPQKGEQTCFNCGNGYPHAEGRECPAATRKCLKCRKYGHYAKLCPEKRETHEKRRPDGKKKYQQANAVQVQNENSDSDYSLAVRTRSAGIRQVPDVVVEINDVNCRMLIDSGATVNILDMKTYDEICATSKSSQSSKLSAPDTKLYAYGGDVPLPLMGKFQATVRINTAKLSHMIHADFYVAEAKGCLLSFATANELGVISIVNALEDDRTQRTKAVMQDFDPLFHGLGKLKDFQLKLNIDDDVPPVHQKHRRVPFSTRPKVEEAIKQLYDDDICENPENTPTPWVSPIVVVPKPHAPDKIRLCVDMRAANKAIKRVKHPMPTVDELIHDLNGCTVFTKLDLTQGYHQVELDPDSRYITTFSSHLGLHRYKRLNFGVNAASEKFQQIIEQVLEGLEDVRNISDIITASKNEDLDFLKIRVQTLFLHCLGMYSYINVHT